MPEQYAESHQKTISVLPRTDAYRQEPAAYVAQPHRRPQQLHTTCKGLQFTRFMNQISTNAHPCEEREAIGNMKWIAYVCVCRERYRIKY